MATSKTDLSLELDRVIACRYPASLVNLAKHLAVADASEVRASISERAPCEIDKLASVVAVALPLWQYTIDILKSLSHSPEFITHLLIREPGLLDALLIKATSSQTAFEEYAELCIKLLSRRLPDSVPLPASAQSFFLQVFERTTTADASDTRALRSLYYMLSGACVGLVNLLPFQTRQEFDEKIHFILSSPATGKNVMQMLWCFGLTILAEHPHVFSRDLDHEMGSVPTALQWRTKAGKKIFQQGPKTVNLACLGVVWATGDGADIEDDEALEGIRIASRTVQFLEDSTRGGWRTSSTRASASFNKLASRIQRTDIDSGIQLEALRFYASIAGGSRIPPELVAEYGKSIGKTCLVAESQSWKECLSMSLPVFVVQMQQPDLPLMLKNILQSSILCTPTLNMENTRILCNELTTISARFPQFRFQMNEALCSSDVEPLLEKFLQIKCLQQDQFRQCQSHKHAVHRELVASTISMTTLLYSTSIAFLRKQQHLPAVIGQCTHPPRFSNLSSVSLFQQECTPLTGTHLQDWKERLKSELENQSHFQQDSIIRSVAQICHDLESRCETVEAPLRQEKERSNQLTEEVAALKEEIESLKLKRWEDSEHINALDADNERIEDERDHINAELTRLKANFEEANAKAAEASHAAQARYDNMETKFRSRIFEHEESVRAQKIENEDLHARILMLSNKLHENELKRQGLVSEAEILQSSLDDMQSKLVIEQEAKNRQDAALQETESELATVSEHLSDLQANLEKMQSKYEDELKTACAEAGRKYELLSNELHEVTEKREAMGRAYEKIQAELQQTQTTIPPLHKKISELTDESLQKDGEIENLSSSLHELRQWRTRIYESMMGLPSEVPPVPRPTKEASNPRTPRSHRRRKSTLAQDSGMVEPAGTQALSATAMENVANASFTSSGSMASECGSTPKRPKPRTSFKVPSMHTPYSHKPALTSRPTSKRLSPTKRSALRDVSPNRRHTTVGFAIPEIEGGQNTQQSLPLRKRRGSLSESGQLDFDLDSFLVGTPRIPVSRVAHSEEDSTTEL
ncbi:hypothetical protein DM02DRAFT_715038 [Periconia macrospinosa]|uniref:Uncharacterized protein n=1 Tax=Periconia macrospinosa TaxID=97972 RepID=A0A2V1EB05_9PLEO|nr:hypothetical protein DM02DRAFT_715038 [Periconia macrospinosa]